MVDQNDGAAELICIVDDDEGVRDSLDNLLRSTGYKVRSFGHPAAFLACDVADAAACLILDVKLGDVNGLDFQQELVDSDAHVPVILISGHGDIPMTVRAMRAGAVTFLTKPFEEGDMLAAIGEALTRDRSRRDANRVEDGLHARYDALTARERDVFGLVTSGLMNKQIAGRLELSEVTVKIHRGNMMRKMEADSLADLVRMAETLRVRENVSRYVRRDVGGSKP
ncbi:response regulator transcription factor [Nguyenibacter vanlangensis]|uniref:Response regulator transcription factor n=1 Tax=Nguyenibacter vanlangensis TaxID=1216886 RepID=A0A7Y7M4L3_9PROT|nr:response regulator [Nguyenibacter vanlangensis]NVN10102.1 response regulator transcription factor [Nguyenibacter vanlangensis]